MATSTKIVLQIDVDDKGNPTLRDLDKNMGKATKSASKFGSAMKAAAGSIALWKGISALQNSIAFTGKEIFDFNKILKQTQAITGTSDKNIEKLKDLILDLGNVTEFTATEIAGAALQVTKMGVSVDEQLSLLPSVLNLATSAVVDLSDAVEVSAQTAKAFGIDLRDLESVANIIQTTISSTAIGLDNFKETMKFVAPIAVTAGVSIEELSASIGILGDIGIKGSLAGTALKNIMTNLLNPTKEVAAALRDMNIQATTLPELLKNMGIQGFKVKDFLEGFNLRALPAVLALKEMVKQTGELNKKLDEQSIKVKEVAAITRTSWIDQLQKLRNVIVGVGIEFSRAFEGLTTGGDFEAANKFFVDLQKTIRANRSEIREFVQKGLNIMIKAFKFIINNTDEILAIFKFLILKKVAIGIAALAIKIGSMGKALAATSVQFSVLSKTPASINSVASAIGKLTIALGLAAIAWELLNSKAEDWEKASKRAAEAGGATDFAGVNTKIKALELLQKSLRNIEAMQTLVEGFDPSKITRPQSAEFDIGKFGTNFESQVAKSLFEMTEAFGELKKQITTDTGLSGSFFSMNDTVKKINFSLKIFRNTAEELNKAQKEAQRILDAENARDKKEKITKKFDPGPLSQQELDKLPDVGKFWAENLMKIIRKDGMPVSIISNTAKQTALPTFAQSLIEFSSQGQIKLNQALRDNEFAIHLLSNNMLGLMQQVTGAQTPLSPIDIEDPINVKAFEVASKNAKQTAKKEFGEISTMLLGTSKLIERTKKEIQQDKFDKVREISGFIQSTTSQLSTAIAGLISVRSQAEINAIDESLSALEKDKNDRLKLLEGNKRGQLAVEAAFNRKREELEAKREEKLKDNARKQKKIAITQAIVNVALGVTSALAAPYPLNLIDSVLVGALGAIQIATIASQKFSHGGTVKGTGNSTSDSIPIFASAGEVIIPAVQARAVGGATGVQEKLNADVNFIAGNMANRGGITIKIDTFIGQKEYERGLFERIEKERSRWGSGI